ncbi:MAG: hypothetical protein E6X72_05680 [Clostridioides difficile]|nr:hypothetical protein [Clostridium butyricum]MDU4853869.1 hypothetical protein [Clostridioides difficile]
MKNFKRLLAGFIAVLSLIAIKPIAANAEWKSNTTGWWYTQRSSWATGWRNINGNWYYFYSDGYMAHDCWIEDCYLNSSGYGQQICQVQRQQLIIQMFKVLQIQM